MSSPDLGTELGKAIGAGFASGFTTLLAATVLLVPVSYVLNRFVYHGLTMRIMMGFLAVMLAPILFVGLLISRMAGLSKVYYFGMLPLVSTQVSTEGAGWGTKVFGTIWNVITHPVNMFFNDAGYGKAVETLLLAPGATAPAVDEELFAAARKVGAIADRDKWTAASAALADQGKRWFGSIATDV